jgi:DNA repair exonuclease SbcCD ATPase subunit
MNLSFRRLVIRNFKAFQGPVKLDLASQGLGLHFVAGKNVLEPSLHSNGAGKSSLWDALIWCLYGKTVDNLRNPDIKPWTGARETRVTLLFRCDEAHHRVTRTTFPNRLALDGEIVSQDRIDNTLGMGFDLFTNTILMGQGRPLFLELPPRDKLDLFSTVLDLEKWERRSSKAAELTKELDRALIRLEEAVRQGQGELERVKASIEETKVEHDRWETTRFQDDLNAIAEVKRLEKSVTSLRSERDKADLEYDSAETEIRAQRAHKTQLQEYLELATAQQQQEERELAAKRTELTEIRAELVRELADGDTCPTCGQQMTAQGLGEHRKRLKQKRDTLKAAIELGVSAGTLSAISDLHAQLATLKESALEFQRKADAANDRMIALDPQLAQLEAKIEQTKVTKSRREREENPFEFQLAQLRSQRAQAKENIRGAQEEIEAKTRDRARTAFWVKGFKDVRLFVIEEVLLELEVASNALLDQFGLMGWAIRYSIERETQSGNVSRALNVEIISPHNSGPVRFESWSGGQQQRLRLIGSLALSDVLLERAGVRPSMEILDEPSRSITSRGVCDIVDALADRASQRQMQIYYTDHSAVQSSRFANSIVVTLDANGAHL